MKIVFSTIESPKTSINIQILYEYHGHLNMFSKAKASGLPPYCEYNCAIKLLPGTTPPRGEMYPISLREQKGMEEYVQEALKQGYIGPSTSLALASFFFVKKKYGGQRPCIDLNAIRVKYAHPLPLVPVAIFTKLDLMSAFNLIWIRKGN